MTVPEREPFNPYAAPAAAALDESNGGAEPVYFSVGLLKLAVMCVFTFGLYEFYWFYRQWEAVRRGHALRLNAPLRAVCFPLTSYALFQQIAHESRRLQIPCAIQPLPLALGVLVIASLLRMPDPYWMLSLLGFLPLIPIQSAINEIHERLSPNAPRNTGYSTLNLITIVPGMLILVPLLLNIFVAHWLLSGA